MLVLSERAGKKLSEMFSPVAATGSRKLDDTSLIYGGQALQQQQQSTSLRNATVVPSYTSSSTAFQIRSSISGVDLNYLKAPSSDVMHLLEKRRITPALHPPASTALLGDGLPSASGLQLSLVVSALQV